MNLPCRVSFGPDVLTSGGLRGVAIVWERGDCTPDLFGIRLEENTGSKAGRDIRLQLLPDVFPQYFVAFVAVYAAGI